MSESALPNGWELVVGLEVHVELATRTKLFSASANRFGDEPNTHIDPVTLGLPGALPVLNRRAVEMAMSIGLALNCTVQPSVPSCRIASRALIPCRSGTVPGGTLLTRFTNGSSSEPAETSSASRRSTRTGGTGSTVGGTPR